MLSLGYLNRTFNPETVLMIIISRLYFNKADKNQVQDFINLNQINWKAFYELISAHSVRPFIYHLILKTKLTTDKDFEQRLRTDVLPLNIRSLHQRQQIDYLVDNLNELNIKVVPYKGVTFGDTYYESAALRESTDIDLLVSKSDIPQIAKYLIHENYKSQKLSGALMKYQLANGRDIIFETPVSPIGISCKVELQWALLKKHTGKFPNSSFFINQTKKVNGRIQLNPTYDFLALVSHHFLKDLLTKFKYVVDTACLLHVKGAEIDTELVTQIINTHAYSKLFTTSLSAVNDLLGINTPGFEITAIVNNTLVSSSVMYPILTKINDLEHTKLFISLQNNNWQKFRTILRLSSVMLPNSKEVNDHSTPSYLFPLQFLIRPIRVVSNTLIKLIKKKVKAVTG
jgi:hypothetical protein